MATTDTRAAYELEQQACALGIHSLDCREGRGEIIEIFTVGCAPCEERLREFHRWEMQDGAPEYDPEAWAEAFDPAHPGYRAA